MAGNPYVVVGEPNYATPDVSKFFQSDQKQGQQQKNTSLMDALQQFLNGPALAPGSAIPGAAGPTSVGGPNGPMPLMQSAPAPMMNAQGMGLY